jgi:hypothetical protein
MEYTARLEIEVETLQKELAGYRQSTNLNLKDLDPDNKIKNVKMLHAIFGLLEEFVENDMKNTFPYDSDTKDDWKELEGLYRWWKGYKTFRKRDIKQERQKMSQLCLLSSLIV